MTSRKVFGIVIGITFLVWLGVAIYFLKPSKKSLLSGTPTSSLSKALSPALEKNYILIKKGKALSSYLLYLTYNGVLENKRGDEWTIKGEEETVIFKLTPETRFFKTATVAGEEIREEINQEVIKLGDVLQVTVAVVEREKFSQEIERGDLRNQNTVSVDLTVSGLR